MNIFNMRTLELVVLLLLNLCSVWNHEITNDNGSFSNEAINRTYRIGVDKGIINPKKYPLETFKRDEYNIFRDLYSEYASLNGSHPIGYPEWIVLNNFGLLPDIQESLFVRKISKRSTVADDKTQFINTVKKGDILITGRGIGGLIGHSAIMTSDDIVLEMPGGADWYKGIPNNNRQVEKGAWFDERKSELKFVFRCPDSDASNDAAEWTRRNYYNPTGGDKKTIHVTYKITGDLWSLDPSYCSKLVIQAFEMGVSEKDIITDDIPPVIVPTAIPLYFLKPYKLKNMGKY